MDCFDRVISRTARKLSKELDRMLADLDMEWTPQTAYECVLITLSACNPA